MFMSKEYKEYAVYDMKDYEQCVRIGTMKEIAEFLNCSSDGIRSYISHKKAGKTESLIHKRYEVVKVTDEEDDEEEIIKKTNVEIFREIIDAFMPEKHNFEVFDSYKYEIKRKKDLIIVNEEWKQIEGYNYSVSNYGRIMNNTSKKIKSLRNGIYGYQVNLWNKSQGKMFTLSRLVANYFIRKVEENERVKHKDQDIRNNYYKNLEIVSK